MEQESNIKTVQILPPKQDYALCSSLGGRSSQQDSLFADCTDGTFFAVICDGMGGMNGGEKASELGVRLFAEGFYARKFSDVPAFLAQTAKAADEAIFSLEEDGRPLGAGSTVVAVYQREHLLYWLSVGDSRIYLFRNGELCCPLKPHNYGQRLKEQLAEGTIDEQQYEEGQKDAEALTSFLGIGGLKQLEINQNPFLLEKGDQILLCSDGLYKSLTDAQIREVLQSRMQTAEKAQILLEKALEQGGVRQDNTSIILCAYHG